MPSKDAVAGIVDVRTWQAKLRQRFLILEH